MSAQKNKNGSPEDAVPFMQNAAEPSGQALPDEFYGLLTQIMLYVRKMDEEYARCGNKERDR